MKKTVSLVDRIKFYFSESNITPAAELLSYASSCDDFSSGKISADVLQDLMCHYLDSCAVRAKSLSRALGRTREPALAEVVTETINMFADAVTRSEPLRHLDLSVTSEKTVKLSSGKYIKPDVGIWCDDQKRLLVAIECKTSLGYQRKVWMNDYEKRSEDLNSIGVEKSSFILFVGTENTWGGFPKDDVRYRKNWFSLCPAGSWYGGGVNREVPLSQLQHPGTLNLMGAAVVSACSTIFKIL